MWLPGLAEAGCGLVARSDKVCEKLCAGLLSESSIGMSKCLKIEVRGALLEDEVGKMCARL